MVDQVRLLELQVTDLEDSNQNHPKLYHHRPVCNSRSLKLPQWSNHPYLP